MPFQIIFQSIEGIIKNNGKYFEKKKIFLSSSSSRLAIKKKDFPGLS